MQQANSPGKVPTEQSYCLMDSGGGITVECFRDAFIGGSRKHISQHILLHTHTVCVDPQMPSFTECDPEPDESRVISISRVINNMIRAERAKRSH